VRALGAAVIAVCDRSIHSGGRQRGEAAVALTEGRIGACAGHKDLFELLSEELQTRLPDGQDRDLDLFLKRIRLLPVGLRAMAATYEFDVSLTLDDLGWHFCNWCHRPYCEETLWALRELEAFEYAEAFAQAYEMAQPYWCQIAELRWEDFPKWYNRSQFHEMTLPLSKRLWELQRIDDGLFGYWTKYTRKYPHKVTEITLQ
jgi:hypothetical protein